ncbi:MAG: EAL domain-containing protein, partial [Methylococcaceae bacterium]|nr:EAL domain-containing protein [Methylococcaceae bacterium]
KPDAGQVVIWQNINDIHALFNHHLKINIFYALTAFFIIEILVFFAIRIVSSRLNKTIHIQTLELNSRNNVLEQLARETPLHTILESLVHIIEKEIPEAVCSILLLDAEGKHLLSGAAPSLPDFYNAAVNGLEIGESIGSCGRAAFTKKRVIVEDIQTSSYWTPYRELAAKAGLASCWSEPIIDHKDNVLGTFAIYHQTPTRPKLSDLVLIESIIKLATLVIERKHIDEKLQLLSRIYEQTRDGITITNTEGKIVDVNPVFCDITGYSRDEVIGQNPSILSSGKQSPEFYAEMWRTIEHSGHWQGEVWNRKKNGEIYAELLTISSIQDDENNTSHFVGLFSDITLNKEQQKALELMAHYDVLTQLPNRTLFADRFNQAIAHCKRNETLLAVCFLDLDEFKPVNDTYGHDVGDQLLIQVAERIKSNIREEDTVSRQGGDEFTLLLGDIESPFHGEQMLKRLNRSLAQPYLIDNNLISISASIGVAIYPTEDSDLDTLLRHADQAMYQAKVAGRNRFHLFNAEQDQENTEKHTQLNEIDRALNDNEFRLYYQPKVNMKTGVVFGAEALLRWIHPEKGLIPPLDFLPLIEGTELEIHVGNWVIEEALQQLKTWQEQNINIEVSVNISSHHLQSVDFFASLDSALAKHPSVNAKFLQLEILESSALGDLATISSIIKTCQDTLGVNIALDDFGTGYSSLTHLRNLPANTIKIDQSFVRDMLDDPNDFAIIDGVIGLADSFNREIIAEGVETTEHGLMLLLMGCHEAQGYGISRPMPAAEFPNWLANYTPNQEWLSYANKYHSIKETKIKLLRLTTQHWFKTFKIRLTSQTDQSNKWPVYNHKKCHHGAWIEREKKEQLFDNVWLNRLVRVHEDMHLIANKLTDKRLENPDNISKDDIKSLEAVFDKMSLILGQYE